MTSSPKPAFVVSAEPAGLGNRLKSWVSAMRLGEEARVYWPLNKYMPAHFGNLFSNDCALDAVPSDAVVYSSWRLAVTPDDEPHLPAGFATAGGGAHPIVRALGKAWWSLTGKRTDRYRYMVYPKSYSRRMTRADGRNIDFEYERIPQAVRDTYRPFFGTVRVQPALVQRADEWASANLAPSAIGVQIRTWRDDPRRHRKYHPPAWRRLLRLLDELDGHTQLLVVSDSDDAVQSLRSRYGDRVTSFPRVTPRLQSWHTAEGISEDLIDMVLLSRTPELIGSYFSTFAEVAWWLGGARAKVKVF